MTQTGHADMARMVLILHYSEKMSMTDFQVALVRGLQARNRLLLIQALIGIEVGLFIILTGGPGPIEEHFGPWGRMYLGAQSVLPGIVTLIALLVGITTRPGRWMAFAGILGLLVWQLCMAAIYIVQAIQGGVLLVPGEAMPSGAALSYVFWVYLNLAMLMTVHLIELLYSTFRRGRAVGSIHLGPPPH